MQITLIGQTDKRPVIYTLLKMMENMGDCCYITNDRKACRLMEEGPGMAGTYRDIDIFVLDTTADDMWTDIGYAPSDYEFIILDNLYNEMTDLIIYVKGAGDAEEDLEVLDVFEPSEYVTIKMGKPDKAKRGGIGLGKGKSKSKAKQPSEEVHKTYNIPYSAGMMENIEYSEFFKQLKPASQAALKVCAELLAGKVNVSAKNLGKVATTKR